MRDYQRNTAEAILQPETWAPHWKSLVQITDQGVFLSRTGHSDRDLAWSPACVKSSFDAIDQPVLPFPFFEQDLAAFMLDGMGARIVAEFGVLGQAPFPGALKRYSQTEQSVVHALNRAFACIQSAQIREGAFDSTYELKMVRQRDELWAARKERASLTARLAELVHEGERANPTDRPALLQDVVAISSQLRTTHQRVVNAELAYQQATEAYQDAWRTWRDKMVVTLYEAKEVESDAPFVNNAAVQHDNVTATRSELIKAFGPCSGMNETWFRLLPDSPALMRARHTKGCGGRHHREPTFFVWPVVRWLLSPKNKRVKRNIRESSLWAAYEKHFPDSANFNSAAKPDGEPI